MKISFLNCFKYQNLSYSSCRINHNHLAYLNEDTVSFGSPIDLETLRERRTGMKPDNKSDNGLIDVPPDMLVPVGDGHLYDEKPAAVSSSPLRAQIKPEDLSEEMKEDLVKRLDSSRGKLGLFWHILQKGKQDKKTLAVRLLMYLDIDKQILEINGAVHDKTNLIVDEITEKIKDASLEDLKQMGNKIQKEVFPKTRYFSDNGVTKDLANRLDSEGGKLGYLWKSVNKTTENKEEAAEELLFVLLFDDEDMKVGDATSHKIYEIIDQLHKRIEHISDKDLNQISQKIIERLSSDCSDALADNSDSHSRIGDRNFLEKDNEHTNGHHEADEVYADNDTGFDPFDGEDLGF